MNININHIRTILLYGGAMGVTSLVPFIMLPLLTNELSVEDFGVLALIETSILFMVPIVSIKIEAGVGVQYFKLTQHHFKIYVINALFLSLLAFFIVFSAIFIFNDVLSQYIGLTPAYVLVLPVFALLRVVGAVMLTMFRSQSKPGYFFILSLIQSVIDIVLSIFLVVIFKNGIIGRLQGVYGALLIVTLLGLIYLYKNGYFLYWRLKYTKQILSYSLPLIPHSIAGVVIVMSDRYFLANYYGPQEVGLYAASYQIAAVMLLMGTVINLFWSPLLYSCLRDKTYTEAIRGGGGIAIFLLIAAAFMYGIHDLLYSLLVDEKFFVSKMFFVWLLLGFLFQSLYFLLANYLFYYSKTILLAVLTVVGAVVNLVLNYLLIERFASIGVAYSTAITWFVLLFMVFVTVVFNHSRWQEKC